MLSSAKGMRVRQKARCRAISFVCVFNLPPPQYKVRAMVNWILHEDDRTTICVRSPHKILHEIQVAKNITEEKNLESSSL